MHTHTDIYQFIGEKNIYCCYLDYKSQSSIPDFYAKLLHTIHPKSYCSF